RHEQLVARLFELLENAGLLHRCAEEWEVGTFPSNDDLGRSWSALLADFPACSAELTLLGRCGRHLAEVLRGEGDPLELIFPENSGTAEHVYDTASGVRLYNALLGAAVADLAARLPARRTLRILEVGAGTGGTTGHVLAHLPAERVSYTYTDLSSALLS